MGGTFDPIHHGHLLSAETVRQKLGLDAVVFIPAAQSPFKQNREAADALHRYQMVNLAIADNPHFFASDIELERGGVTYTVDTVKEIAAEYLGADIFFIIGADQLANLHKWKSIDELMGLCTFVCTNRPGAELNSVIEHLKYVEIPPWDVSSTEIRCKVRCGDSIKYLVPSLVGGYIKKHGIFREGE